MVADGKKMGLDSKDVFPYGNPQGLTMGEMEDRIHAIGLVGDSRFMGGAWSGD